jgi:hypothetical protein
MGGRGRRRSDEEEIALQKKRDSPRVKIRGLFSQGDADC